MSSRLSSGLVRGRSLGKYVSGSSLNPDSDAEYIHREKFKSVNKSLVLVDDHEGLKCLKYLAEDADTSRAHHRVRADSENRARIETHLSDRPEGAEIVCRICDALTDESGRDWRLTLECEADDIVYHFNWK